MHTKGFISVAVLLVLCGCASGSGSSGCKRVLRAADVVILKERAISLNRRDLPRPWSALRPRMTKLENDAGQRFTTIEFGSGSEEQCLCCDVFVFTADDASHDERLVSVALVRTFDSVSSAIQSADAVWREVTGEEVGSRLRSDALIRDGALVTFASMPSDRFTSAAITLSLERSGAIVILRLHLTPPEEALQ